MMHAPPDLAAKLDEFLEANGVAPRSVAALVFVAGMTAMLHVLATRRAIGAADADATAAEIDALVTKVEPDDAAAAAPPPRCRRGRPAGRLH